MRFAAFQAGTTLLSFMLAVSLCAPLASAQSSVAEIPADNGDKTLGRLSGFTGEVASGYRWGRYATPGQDDDAHGGVGLQFEGGYRFENGLEADALINFAFPQISVPEASNDASFSYRSFGLLIGYLWRDRVEPYIHYSPFAELSQSTSARLGVGRVNTDLSYQGQAMGAGLKIYLTERQKKAVQVGLNFNYTHEIYSGVKYSSSIEPVNDHPAPDYNANSDHPAGNPSVHGDTYQMGVFIGI